MDNSNGSNLARDEEIVYNIVKEYTKRKPVVEVIDLINYVNYRLRLNPEFNKNKIERIIKQMIRENIILIGTKLVKEDILTLPARKQINGYIHDNPGTNINEIKEQLHIGSNQVIWHLKYLDKFKFIRIRDIENQKVLFPANLDAGDDTFFFFLRNKKVKAIIDLLENSPEPLRPTQIADLLSIHFNTIKKYLQILVQLNLLKKVNGTKIKRFVLEKGVYREILNKIKGTS